MSISKRLGAAGVALAATVALAALFVAPAGATRVVKIHSTLTISAYAYNGKVKGNANCTEGRTIVLKEKGHGKIGATKSGKEGRWEVNPETIKYKGQLPYRIYAEAKQLDQGTAGTIYRCLAATSRTIKIAGG